ncbi:MAG: hypothetical protein FWC25_03345 [Dehalococcoidia bacterium]|nr:hypothetical protein [Dehalococcoidia bacterium]
MNSAIWKYKISLIIFMCLIALAVMTGCSFRSPKWEHATSYSSLLGRSDFNVVAEEIGSSTQGTILVSQSKPDVLDIKIVASIVIAPNDWAGVSFYFPEGCYVEDILCTYVDNIGFERSFEMSSLGEVVIGSYNPGDTNGGAGTVIIDCVMPVVAKNKISEMEFSICVGAKWVDGTAPIPSVTVIKPTYSENLIAEIHEGINPGGYWIRGIAHEKIVVVISDITPERLAADIAYQINRSERIIELINSGGNLVDNRDEALLREQENRIRLLSILQDELNQLGGSESTDSQGINNLYQRYKNIIEN